MQYTTLLIGQMTKAQRARRFLEGEGVIAYLVKENTEKYGCIYGVKVFTASHFTATAILKKYGIPIMMTI